MKKKLTTILLILLLLFNLLALAENVSAKGNEVIEEKRLRSLT